MADVNVKIRQPAPQAVEAITIEVELRPHVGVMQTRFGPVKVQQNQFIILAGPDGGDVVQVGYVGKQAGAPINWIRDANGQPFPDLIKGAVREAIATELGQAERREAQPPPPTTADELDEDLDEDLAELDDDLDSGG